MTKNPWVSGLAALVETQRNPRAEGFQFAQVVFVLALDADLFLSHSVLISPAPLAMSHFISQPRTYLSHPLLPFTGIIQHSCGILCFFYFVT